VARSLAAELASDFAVEPTVLVSVAALAPEGQEPGVELMDVFIIGEANAPGRKEVETGTTLLQFLAEAGGLSRFAAEKRIQLRRIDPASGQERVYRFNYRDMGGANSISGTTVLAPGDVVVVPERRLFE
jgi:polysaccharide export outer membrane protein